MAEQDPTPVTRRERRAAEQSRRPSQAATPQVTPERAPTTRRELRLADQACRSPFSLVLSPPAVRRQGRTAGRDRTAARTALSRQHTMSRPATVGVLAAALLLGGMTQVHAEHRSRNQQQADATTAAALNQLRAERVDRATTTRLTGEAAGFAAAKREEALVVARDAVDTAGAVSADAMELVTPETIAALDAAVAELTSLIETSPVAPASLEEEPPDAELDEETPETADGESALPFRSPPVPGADRSASAASRSAAPALPTDLPDVDVTAPDPAAPDGSLEPQDGPTELPESADVDALDLDVSAQILAAAQDVAALSDQLQASAAEAEAAREAAEAAARAAAAEIERKIAVASDAPNGQIPTDALCGVSFARDALIRCDAAAALEELNAAYRADFGTDLTIVSSYRSYDRQVAVKRSRGSLAATPGTSNHGLALAVDFGGFGGLGQFGSANYRWMKANAERFGWYHPRIMQPGGGGPQEPWHWEFDAQ
ncbi:M15 family metallopeptidase [Actinotalea sp. K2]|uniref:M15 family metallopeptidase n=1 Tax=Actinotalea sp. K2 TaxID=2939438 RepID=UPI002016F93D|nr:M15 family metallopeptidase [Actinotalea sp. K2]MCL3862376.1 M15 family metallopeptidase [Actinotalea sp. K2]